METLLLQIYVLLLTIFGVLTANKELIGFFDGGKILILIAVLILFYNLMIFVSNKIMIFVGSILMKMADKKGYSKELAKKQTIRYMIAIYFAHLLSLYLGKFLNIGIWSNATYMIAIAFIMFNIFNNKQYKKIVSKVMVVIPFLAYIVIDVFLK